MHIKLCNFKLDCVKVSMVIIVYCIITAAYNANVSLRASQKFPDDSVERSTATFNYTFRMVLQLVGCTFLTWGVLGKQTTGLLIWLFVAICYIVRDTTAKIQYLLLDRVEIELVDNIIQYIIIGLYSI